MSFYAALSGPNREMSATKIAILLGPWLFTYVVCCENAGSLKYRRRCRLKYWCRISLHLLMNFKKYRRHLADPGILSCKISESGILSCNGFSELIFVITITASYELILVPFLHRRLHGGLSNALMALIQWHARNFLEGRGRELLVKHAFLLGIRTSYSQSRGARVFLHVHQPGYLNGHVVWGSWKQGNEERLRLPTSRN